MIYKASKLIAAGFDQRGIKYGNRIEETSSNSFVEAGFTIDNGPNVLVKFISTDNDNDVAVRVWRLVKVTEEKKQAISIVANDLNNTYRYTKFVIDDDGDLDVEYDFPLRISDDCIGEVAGEIFFRFMDIIEKAYPKIMQAIWMN